MEITIPFAEVSNYVEKHYGQKIGLSSISDKEVEAIYKKKLVIMNFNLKVEITIEEVQPAAVTISYDSNFAVEYAISKVLTFLKNKYRDFGNALTLHPGHKVTIDLLKIKDADSLTSVLALTDIEVRDENIVIMATLK